MRLCSQDISRYFPKTHLDRTQKIDDPAQGRQRRILSAIETRTGKDLTGYGKEYCTFAEHVRRQAERLLADHPEIPVNRTLPSGVLRILQLIQQRRLQFPRKIPILAAEVFMDYLQHDPQGDLQAWMDYRRRNVCGSGSALDQALQVMDEALEEESRKQRAQQETGERKAA